MHEIQLEGFSSPPRPSLASRIATIATASMCGVLMLTIISLITESDQSITAVSKNHSFLFKKQAVNELFKEENTVDFPLAQVENENSRFDINAKFVTVHLFPVRRCKVLLVIDGVEFSKEPDVQGVVQMSGFFQRHMTESKVNITIFIESGRDENVLKNNFTEPLERSLSNLQLYQLNHQFIYHPVNPQLTQIIGRVVDDSNVPIAKVPIKISYEQPVFQDIIVFYTEADGTFDAQAKLDQLIPMFGNIVIDFPPYAEWDMKRDSDFKQGFFLMNHLEFKFEQDIVLKTKQILIKIDGRVINRRKEAVPGAKLSIECKSPVDGTKVQYNLTPTDNNGTFSIQQRTNFTPQTRVDCVLNVNPVQTKYRPTSVNVELFKEKGYKVEGLVIVLTTEPILGRIKGKVVSELRNTPIQGIDVRYDITGQDKLNISDVRTSSLGLFEMPTHGYRTEVYTGELIFESSAYETYKMPLTLTEAQMFSADVGIIKLKEKAIPIELILTGVFVEKTLQRILPNFDFTLSLVLQPGQPRFMPMKTDAEGRFEYRQKGMNYEIYDMVIKVVESEEFQSITLKRTFSSVNNFNGDLKVVEVPRQLINGLIAGTVTNELTGSYIQYARLLVTTDLKMPPQKNGPPVCKSDFKGDYECRFQVEKWLVYEATMLLETSIKESASFVAGQLNKGNLYTIRGLKSSVRLAIVNPHGLLSGIVKDSETDKALDNCTYKVNSISPPAEDQDQVVNIERNCTALGEFSINMELKAGPHKVTATFSAPHLPSAIQIFLLDFPTQYRLTDQIVYLGEHMTGQVSGHVKTKQFLPIEGALVTVEMRGRMHTAFSEKSGAFLIKVPAKVTEPQDSGIIRATKERFGDYEHEIIFLKSRKFTITRYEIILFSEKWKSHVNGHVVDERRNPVPFASLSLLLKDSSHKSITEFPYTTVSDLQGQFSFEVEVTYDDTYSGVISVMANFFMDTSETIVLNGGNKYTIDNKIIVLQRKHVLLEYSGTLITTLHKPLPALSIKLDFNDEAQTHQVRDMSLSDTEGKFKFQQKVLFGYNYTAVAIFKAYLEYRDYEFGQLSTGVAELPATYEGANEERSNYETYSSLETNNVDLIFNPENNYRLVFQQVIMHRKLVECTVTGIVLDKVTDEPLKGAQVILDFGSVDESDYKSFSYATETGQFTVTQKVPLGMSITGKITGKYPSYFDNTLPIQVHSSKNTCRISNITIRLQKASEADFTQGYIHGHAFSRSGIPITESEVSMYFESEPTNIYTMVTDDTGAFAFDDLPCVKSNEYISQLKLLPRQDNIFLPAKKLVVLNMDNDYEEDDALIIVDRVKTSYQIRGTITDQDTKAPLGGTYVVVSFPDQLDAVGSFGYTDVNGMFDITGQIGIGISYRGNFTLIHAGYETKRPNFDLVPTEDYKYEKRDANYQLKRNPFQKLYYLDEKHTVPISSRVFEITKCNLFPHKYLPFVKVQLYIEFDEINEVNPQSIFIGETYTDEQGYFKIKSPHPIYAEIHIYLVFQKEGYQKLRVFQRLTPEAFYLTPGSFQINNNSGIVDCTRKERKIQNKYDQPK